MKRSRSRDSFKGKRYDNYRDKGHHHMPPKTYKQPFNSDRRPQKDFRKRSSRSPRSPRSDGSRGEDRGRFNKYPGGGGGQKYEPYYKKNNFHRDRMHHQSGYEHHHPYKGGEKKYDDGNKNRHY
mmetsp:Transcript_40257/g.38730  ORF Transcript_40257/g.38730 Transcript_40257/m.38730 type:complete len:124 (+) Transcript_40257:972-1343(+)|eukprot:CAMPEP_0170544608 /NCGR_PEP_ID=MMETSP0211-20121228/3303_1 /TAXON_ID=311385 /ORGANISM="Pseudokeronopsis sp., Strain OXSARD2" /LENGTH=123 /DNA_ID=CAMNT_0010848293 /DNA_START=972 /DNA_END=1343 /DNA_ORIENTATION=-